MGMALAMHEYDTQHVYLYPLRMHMHVGYLLFLCLYATYIIPRERCGW